MENYETITLLYILFIWLVVIHTFEEISQEIFGLKTQLIEKAYEEK